MEMVVGAATLVGYRRLYINDRSNNKLETIEVALKNLDETERESNINKVAELA